MRIFTRRQGTVRRSVARWGMVVLAGAAATAGLVGAPTAKVDKVALAKLTTDADLVWRMNEQGDALGAAGHAGVILAAADALRDAGRFTEARDQYRRVGLLRPWDFAAKLRLCEMHQALGEFEAARAIAAQVARLAETDRELAASARFMDRVAPPELPALAALSPAEGEVVLGLVVTPKTERWLVQAVGARLSALLGLRVGVAPAPFDPGAADRNGRVFLAADLRRTIPWDDPRMSMVRLNGDSFDPARLTPDQVIELMRTLLTREANAKGLEALAERVAAADKVLQWDAGVLLSRLRAEYPQSGSGRTVFVALVPEDLFLGSAEFVFGSAAREGGQAVVSYARFAAAKTGEPPRSERLVTRTTKQLLSSIGFALGVPRCADPGCARSLPRSLAEHDAKDPALCAECRAALGKALGRELPAAAGL